MRTKRLAVFVLSGAALIILSASAVVADDRVLSLADVAAGRAQIVDLTYPLNDRSPFWPGENYRPFKLETIATLEKDGVLSKAFCMPEHFGTHVDAPNHFESNRASVDRIAVQEFFAPGVVIDLQAKAETDPDALLTPDEVAAWEAQHGRIPHGAIVFLSTGWGRFWSRPERFRNRDALGRMHFPGYSPEAARFLIEKRHVKALGIDTLSIDPGISKTFPVHHIVNGAGRYALENVAHLDRLPARGFFVIVAPIKIEGGSGGPARIFALAPKR